MEIIFYIVIGIVIFIIVPKIFDQAKGFDDPTHMSNQKLVAAIAGQADWIEKMRRAPIESQTSPSIVKLTEKRKSYIINLCLEVLSRNVPEDEPKYPGASSPPDIFSEVRGYADELGQQGVSKENSAVRAVKEKLFEENGVFYPSSWEI